MADLRIWTNFNKRINSTKLPDLTAGTVKSVALKESISLENPIFICSDIDFGWNYCLFEYHFYYINDIVFNSDHLYELHCTQDLLATWRTEIKNTSCNILYATGSTKNIIDKRIPVTADCTISDNSQAISGITISGYNNMGAVILGITGKGSFGAYLMQDSTQINDLLDGVDNWATTTITDTLSGLKQLIYGGTASECLKSAIALPIVVGGSDVGGSAEALVLGNYPCQTSSSASIYGYKILKPIITSVTNISIPWQYSDWRRNSPYSEVLLYLPFIGTIPLNSSNLINDDAITVQYSINVTSGDISVQYKGATSGNILGTSSGNIAMATAYGSTGIDTSKLTTSVVAGAGALLGAGITAATGGAGAPIAMGITGGLATIAGGTLSALGGSGFGSGGLGGGASQGLERVMHCYTINRTLTDTQTNFNNIMGKPYMGVSTPGAFTGFVMTEGFSINIAGLHNDKIEINRMMDSGVYIE